MNLSRHLPTSFTNPPTFVGGNLVTHATLSGLKSRRDEMSIEKSYVTPFLNSEGVTEQFPEQRNKNQIRIVAMSH